MSFSKQRFGTNPLANADNITASSQGFGTVAGTKKTGTGSAIMTSSGSYTGAKDLLSTVQIDSLGTGEIGSSTFRWKTSDTAAGSWEATGVATSTSVISLSNGTQIQFTGGSGADFVLNDKWQFWAYAEFGPANLFVNDRDEYWKSGATTSINLVIDMSSATNNTLFVLADHNLTSSATLTLEANATDSWGAPSYTNTISPITDPIVEYIDQTYRYFRIVVSDATNTDGFISIGKLYLGTYSEVSAGEIYGGANWGPGPVKIRYEVRNEADTGKASARVYAEGYDVPLAYTWLTPSEFATLEALWNYTSNVGAGSKISVWLHYWYDVEATMWLCEMISNLPPTYNRGGTATTLNLKQEIMTRVI
jgi:hypothetical protein